VLSLVLSTVAFFAASFFIKRWADDNDLPQGMTRSLSVFVLALAIAYCVAWLVERAAGP
jgi:hypothetical protein